MLGGVPTGVLLGGVLAGQDEACKWVTIQLSHSVCKLSALCPCSFFMCIFMYLSIPHIVHTAAVLHSELSWCTSTTLVKIILAALGLDLEHEMQLIS